jgi:hypothetical protein
MTRRSLIRRALLTLGLYPTGAIGCAAHPAADRGSPPVRAAPDPALELSNAEMEDLVAFGEALVEGRTLALGERRSLVEHIVEQTGRGPRYVALYRTTVVMLERLAGRRFASLEIGERVQLIAHHGLAGAPGRAEDDEEDLEPMPQDLRIVRTSAAPDLIRGYYGSPAGWAVVGYQSFPGRCGDLTRYTRPES